MVTSEQTYVAFEYSQRDPVPHLQPFNTTSPINVPSSRTDSNGYTAFHYYILAPALSNGMIVLGETAKFVTVSAQRIRSIIVSRSPSPVSVSVLVVGDMGESVTMWFAYGQSVWSKACTVPPNKTSVTFVAMTSSATCQ